MVEWFLSLRVWEQIYFWIGVASTLFLIVQIIMLCFSSFGGDLDIDGDGDIDVDTDSGLTLFSVKSVTAFLAVGSWTGLLVCTIASDSLQWLSIIFAILAGAAAWAVVYFMMRAMYKLQSNGTLEPDKLAGLQATVYVSIPEARSGRGKITLTAQGRYLELDAVTDGEKIATDQIVEIISTESECAVVKKADNDNKI